MKFFRPKCNYRKIQEDMTTAVANQTGNGSIVALPLVASGITRFRSQDRLLQQLCQPKNSTGSAGGDSDFDAFIYIVIVVVFYAISMVLLMVKYIRREERDAALDFYYTEFVKREKFRGLNRHKFYTHLFKKIWQRQGPALPISQVYNETKQYACTTDPRCISKEIAQCGRPSLQLGGRHGLRPLGTISEQPEYLRLQGSGTVSEMADNESDKEDLADCQGIVSDAYTFTDDETDTDTDSGEQNASCRRTLRASMYETSV